MRSIYNFQEKSWLSKHSMAKEYLLLYLGVHLVLKHNAYHAMDELEYLLPLLVCDNTILFMDISSFLYLS